MAEINANDVADALYSSYLARDFFAKVIPGAIVILALISPIYTSSEFDWARVEHIPTLAWLFAYGICWIAGFAVQALGEATGAVQAFPADETEEQGRERGVAFNASQLTQRDKSQDERFVVIKEATGNVAVAICLAIVVASAVLGFPEWRLYLYVIVAMSGVVALYWFQLVHRRRQREHELKVLARPREAQPIGAGDLAHKAAPGP